MSGLHWEEVCCPLVLHALWEPQQDPVVEVPHTRMVRGPKGKGSRKLMRSDPPERLHWTTEWPATCVSSQWYLYITLSFSANSTSLHRELCPIHHRPSDKRRSTATLAEVVSGLASVALVFTSGILSHFRAYLTWQSSSSDQRRETRAAARFVSSRSVIQLQRPNKKEADAHPDVATNLTGILNGCRAFHSYTWTQLIFVSKNIIRLLNFILSVIPQEPL